MGKCEGQCCSADAQTKNAQGDCTDDTTPGMCLGCQQCAPQDAYAIDEISAASGFLDNGGVFLVAFGAGCAAAVILAWLIVQRRRKSSEDYQVMSENSS